MAARAAHEAVREASRLAARDHARLTVVAVAEIERSPRGCVFGTSTWNDVLRETPAAADLERARRVVDSSAHFAVLCGQRSRAVAEAARDLGCDAIMVARPHRRLRMLRRDPVAAISRRVGCIVLQPR